MACAKAPFCATGRAAHLDMGSVDGDCPRDTAMAGQGLEQPQPDALTPPAVEAVLDRRIGAVLERAITPTRTALQHVHDARDDATIINTMRALASAWKQRLDPGPLHIAQPGQLPLHQVLQTWRP